MCGGASRGSRASSIRGYADSLRAAAMRIKPSDALGAASTIAGYVPHPAARTAAPILGALGTIAGVLGHGRRRRHRKGGRRC